MKGGVIMPQKDYSGFADGPECPGCCGSGQIDPGSGAACPLCEGSGKEIDWMTRALQAEQEIQKLKEAVGIERRVDMEMMQERDAAVARVTALEGRVRSDNRAFENLTNIFAGAMSLDSAGLQQLHRLTVRHMEKNRAALQPSGEKAEADDE